MVKQIVNLAEPRDVKDLRDITAHALTKSIGDFQRNLEAELPKKVLETIEKNTNEVANALRIGAKKYSATRQSLRSILRDLTIVNGTYPDAPNVEDATVAATYIPYGHEWQFYLSGTATLPVLSTNYDHLRRIEITSPELGDQIGEPLFHEDWSGSTVDYKSIHYPLVTGTYSLVFNAINEDGKRTATPLTKTIVLTAPGEDSITASEGSRYKHPETNGLLTSINFTPVVNNAQYPLHITVWTNDGSGQRWRGWWVMEGPGALSLGAQGTPSEYMVWAPTTADQDWTVTFAVGAIGSTETIPASAKTSDSFQVLRPAAPSATAATGAYIDSITYARGSNQTYSFGWPHLFCTLPLDDENFMYARLTVQSGTGTGTGFVPAGAKMIETPVGDWANDTDHANGFFRTANTNQIYCVNPNLWDIPGDANTTFRFKWYVASRRDDGTGSTKVQQNCWSSGVGISTPGTQPYQDVVVNAGEVTYLSATDEVGSRWQDSRGALHAVMPVTIHLSIYPRTVTIWTVSPQYGQINHGWYELTSDFTINLGAQNSGSSLFPPTIASSESVTVYVALGTWDTAVDPSTIIGVESAAVTVTAPGTYATTGSSTATGSNLTYTTGPGGASQFTVQLDFNLPLTDPNFFFARVTLQTGKYVGGVWTPGGANGGSLFEGVLGTPIGDWAGPTLFRPYTDHAPCFSLVSTVTAGNVRGLVGPYNVPSDGNIVFKFRLYIATRKDDGSGGTKTLQATWPGGADFFDFVVDGTKSYVAGSKVTGSVPEADSVPWIGLSGPLDLGGGGSIQTIQQIKDLAGNVVAWFGKKTIGGIDYYGIWGKNVWIGGDNPTNPKIWLDASGNLRLIGYVESGSGLHIQTNLGDVYIDSATNGVNVQGPSGQFARIAYDGLLMGSGSGGASINPTAFSLLGGKLTGGSLGQFSKIANIPAVGYGVAPIVFETKVSGLTQMNGTGFEVVGINSDASFMNGVYEVNVAVPTLVAGGGYAGSTVIGVWGVNGSIGSLISSGTVVAGGQAHVTCTVATDGTVSFSGSRGVYVNFSCTQTWVNSTFTYYITIRKLRDL
jgi:hypothetical protein